MAYDALINLTAGDLVSETEWDKVNTNFTWLASLQFAGAALSTLADDAYVPTVLTGTYTGDGNATQAITGLGFQPSLVLLYPQVDAMTSQVIKTSSDTTKTSYWATTPQYEDDHIISLDADGFTVGDGTGASIGGNTCNTNLRVMTYIALR